jgi:7-keto-8-aminopelargonate synthetase-like enzyme
LSAAESILSGRLVGGAASARLAIDGREYINFFGAGYLALSNVPEIRAAVTEAVQEGVPFSQQLPAALGATDPIFEDAERQGARALGAAASVYFGSGYLIGSVALTSLERPFASIYLDEHAHYNLRDAARQTGLPIHTFGHCDAEELRNCLSRGKRRGRPVLLTDGVFATTGRIPPLAEYESILAVYDGELIVDESHAFGVVGANGNGAAEYCGVSEKVVRGTTLSKAYCAQGALLGCSVAGAARLRLLSPIRGTCAGSPLSAVAATASLAYVATRPELRETLQTLASYLRTQLSTLGISVIETPAPIVSFQYGDRSQMLALQRRAFEQGIYLYHSDYLGAGPEGVIRCAVFRDHTHEDIDALTSFLKAAA